MTQLRSFVRLDIDRAVPNQTSDFDVRASGPAQAVRIEFLDATAPPLRKVCWS